MGILEGVVTLCRACIRWRPVPSLNQDRSRGNQRFRFFGGRATGARLPLQWTLEQEVALPPHLDFEQRAFERGFRWVAGVDEAGRGPLAGPVSAAAVVLDPDDIPEGLDDSKALTAAERDVVFLAIMAKARAVGIGFASVAEIDAINIRQATFAAMRRAVRALSQAPAYLLIDGKDPPPLMACPIETIVKGDGQSASIAAASIVAKVTRDRLMVRLDTHHPRYGFAAHKGYATPVHRLAIRTYGLSVLHRRLFCRSASTEPDGAPNEA